MKLLLDTHAWLWFALGDARLGPAARELIRDGTNDVLVSPASYWELAVKISVGKYTLSQPYDDFLRHAIEGLRIGVLPVLPAHAVGVTCLPFHHRDPFDRMLAAQALAEGLEVVSDDGMLDAYGVRRVW